MMKITKQILLFLLVVLVVFSCRKDEWDKRNLVSDPAGTESLMDKIKANPDLSIFAGYLEQTGYDQALSSSRTFTVWAPVNEAFDEIDPAYLQDTTNLKLLVGNCIGNQAYYAKEARDSAGGMRIRTLNGKRVLFTGDQLNGNPVNTEDITAKNGVLFIMSKAFKPQLNAFEYLRANYAASKQWNFMKTLFYSPNVDSLLKDSLVNANAIIPSLNTYIRRTNINSEDSLLTYIILTDKAYEADKQRLRPYFIDSTAEVSDSLNQYNVIKDLTVNGVIDPQHIPGTVYSTRDSLAIHLGESQIVKSERVSNGIVYVVDDLNYDLATKIRPIKIEAESFFDRLDPTKGVSIRKRRDPATDSIFYDILLENYGIASFWLRYPTTLHSVNYKVYWRAVNDFQTGTFPMMLAMNHHIDTAFADPKNILFDYTLPYTTVETLDYREVYIGDFNSTRHGLEDIFLIGNAVTTNGQNTIVCDYIKLVPVLN